MTAGIREIILNDQTSKKAYKFPSNRVLTTKFTWITFWPYFAKNELCRPVNLFFFLIIFAQQIDPSDPDKLSTIIPLTAVLSFTLIKDVYENWKRTKMDKQVNESKVTIVKDMNLIEIPCENVKVGDIVRVSKGERFPADLVLISSSEPQGMAYLETSNIDGESNLKIRMSSARTCHLIDLESISDFKGTLKCENPNERIYNFEGSINTGTESFSLDTSNLLLRGAVLKNTGWIYGIAVYTGHDTKIMMNSSDTPNKRTKMQLDTDQKYFYISMGLAVLCLLGTIGNYYHDTQILPKHWYMNPTNDKGVKVDWNAKAFLLVLIKYLMLLNTLVPISLSVTLEFIKLVMAGLVGYDLDLYDEERDCRAVARSSNLMEELGQIQCILTDKTGTLTCNEMVLRHLIIDGTVYEDCRKPESDIIELSKIAGKNNIDFFLKILASCHTIMIDYSDPENSCYQGSSPDELSMVTVASELGYKFTKRSTGSIKIEIRNELFEIEVFAVIEFTSARKRMSVVALLPDNNYYLFCKGADSIILDRLNQESAKSEELKESLKGLEEFARAGLRTLCFAYRKLDRDFALEWLDQWHEALNTVSDRQNKIDSVAKLIEMDMNFIGATGVEDRLQEGVPETIDTLMKANIKIWMLTGDRFETAVSTAFLSNLVQPSTIQLHLLQSSRDAISQSIDHFLELLANRKPGSNFALVLNGEVAEVILSDDFATSPEFKRFRKVLIKCRTLLCCRLSPLQKSQITMFAREQLNYITLAVGDGGNDVSMIQAANVGVGISGKEGLQAARSADFAIAQFKFLTKLILVHGSWSLHRLSRVIMYSIYKNFVLFFIQFWYGFYTNFSAQTFYEPWMYINWNLIFTCWPPTIIGLTDQYVLAKELIQHPQLYEFGQKGKFYDSKTFWKSALNAIFHSFLIFFGIVALFSEGFQLPDQQVSTACMYGSIGFAIVLSVVSLKVLLFTNYLTMLLGILVVASAGSFYLTIPLFRQVKEYGFKNASSLELLSHPVYWASIFLVSVFVLSRDFIWKFYRRQFRPHPYHIVQELKLSKRQKDTGKEGQEPTNVVFEGFDRKPRRSRGFSFSQTYGQTRVLQAYGQSPKLTSDLANLNHKH